MRFRAALAWGPGLGGGELRRKQLPWGPQRPLRPAAAGLLVLLRLLPSLRLCGAVNLAQNLFLTAQFDAGQAFLLPRLGLDFALGFLPVLPPAAFLSAGV